VDIWLLLLEIVILLAGALVLGGIFARFGQSPLVGYLIAGMLSGGPGSFHLVKSEQEIEVIAELGVSLLLFSLGLEFSLKRLLKLGNQALIGGALQVAITLAAMTALAVLCDLAFREAIAVGAMVALSSTAIVLRTLMESGEIDAPYGGNSLAVLLVQDIAVVPLAILIAVLAGGEGPAEIAMNLGRTILLAGLLVAGLFVLLNYVAVRALGGLTLVRNRELTTILAVVVGLGSAWIAHKVGISPALGAFVAGMFLGGSPFATQIRADVSSLRVVLLTLFFGAAGMIADPIWIAQHAGLVLATTAVIMFVKWAIVWLIFQGLGQHPAVAATTGICLAQIGEFAFVLGAVARSAGAISAETHMLIVSSTIVSLLISPTLLGYAGRFGYRVANLFFRSRASSLSDSSPEAKSGHIVIVGFGPAGQIAADAIGRANVNVVVVDLNAAGIRKASELGFEGHIGDATQREVLEHAHVPHAKAVIVTVPHHRTAVMVVAAVRELAPNAHVIARSRYQRDIYDLVISGADMIFGDEAEIGNELGRHLKDWLQTHGKTESQSIEPEPSEESPEKISGEQDAAEQ